MPEYRRHLPHQIPNDAIIFLTWNLKGAFPKEVLDRLERQRDELRRQPQRADESARDRALRHGKLIFATADEFLDQTRDGPLYLKDPSAAQVVENAILYGVGERYELFAWCVMANHVHLLLAPIWTLSKITQGIKGYTAHEVNRLNGEVGRTFWQDESYDHWVRDEQELLRIIFYIENNSVKAGVCERAQNWPWSSARLRGNWPVGQAFQPDLHRMVKKSGWKA